MRGRPAEALQLCRRAASLDPKSVMARSLLSELLLELGDEVGAVEEMAVTTDLAKQTASSRGALELARRSRAEVEASVIEEVLGKEEREPWDLARLFGETEAGRRASRDFNIALALAGLLGHACGLAAAAMLNPLGFLWLALTAITVYWTGRHARRHEGSARFWIGLNLATGPLGFVLYLLNHD
jgi:hypothetical protein